MSAGRFDEVAELLKTCFTIVDIIFFRFNLFIYVTYFAKVRKYFSNGTENFHRFLKCVLRLATAVSFVKIIEVIILLTIANDPPRYG